MCFLPLPKAGPSEAAKQPDNVAQRLGHGLGRQPKHGATHRALGIALPAATTPAKLEPLRDPGVAPCEAQGPPGRREQLELAVMWKRLPGREQRVRPFLAALPPARERD